MKETTHLPDDVSEVDGLFLDHHVLELRAPCQAPEPPYDDHHELEPVAAPEECSSNWATLSRSLATSSSKAASLSWVASDDMPGGGAFGGTRPGCAFATMSPGTTARPVGSLQCSDMTDSTSRLLSQ